MGRPKSTQFAGAAMLAVLVFAVFGQTAGHGFISYDDPYYLTENPVVLRGVTAEGLRWAFGISLGNWHPLAWLSHMADVEFFGLNPGAHHLTSVAIHAGSAVLLFLLLRSLTGSAWRSLFVAATFAVHPLRAESVAWAAERKDVLSAFFWFLTLAAWLGYVRRPGWRRYVSAITLFSLGLASKPMVMTLPAVLLLADWWPLGRFRGGAADRPPVPARTLLVEKIPFLLLSAASLAVTLVAQTRDAVTFVSPDLPTRIANAAASSAWYVGKLFYPSGLAVLYPYPTGGIPRWQFVAAGLFLLSATAVALLLARRRPYLAAGWFWYLVTLAPVLGLVQIGAQARADRYTYLPLVGVTVAVAWLLAETVPRSRAGRVSLAVASVAAVLVLAAAASVQAGRWRDGVTLYRHTLRVTGDNPIIQYNLGTDLRGQGRFPEAAEAFREVLRIDPLHASAYNNLGDLGFKAGRHAEAAGLFGEAVRLEPSNTVFRFNLGMALARDGRKEAALEQWRMIRAADPDRARRLYPEIFP